MPAFFSKEQMHKEPFYLQIYRQSYGFYSELRKNALELLPTKIQVLEINVDSKEIAKLAQLARINIDETMVGDVADNINNILALVDQLKNANTDGVEPMSHPMDALQRLRADNITEDNKRSELQAVAPATDKGLFLVPQVID